MSGGEGRNPKRCQGLALLCAVVCIWVASSLTIQHMEDELGVGPLLLTYISTALFTLLLPSGMQQWREAASRDAEAVQPLVPIIKLAAKFAGLWFLANAFFNLGLKYTSVGSSSVISSSSSGFTLLLSWVWLNESVNCRKISAVLLCSAGITLVSLVDMNVPHAGGHSSSATAPLLGDVLSLAGAVSYAAYSVFLKAEQCGDQVDMNLFFGFVGLVNIVALPPVLFLAALTGIEPWEQSFGALDSSKMLLLIGNGLIGTVLSDLMWAHSVKLLGPVIPSVGLGLTIPLSMLAQVALGTQLFSIWYYVGAALTLLGFLLLILEPDQDNVSDDSETKGLYSSPESLDWEIEPDDDLDALSPL